MRITHKEKPKQPRSDNKNKTKQIPNPNKYSHNLIDLSYLSDNEKVKQIK